MFAKRYFLAVSTLILALLSFFLPWRAQAQTETVLYSFCSQPNCTDGDEAYTSLIIDKHGNLYGTTSSGGSTGWGLVFEVSPAGKETVLYNFCSQAGCTDGGLPSSGLIKDDRGHLYGTTEDGGSNNWGTVFELSPPLTADGAWSEKVLYRFGNPSDGIGPVGNLVRDKVGNFYGVVASGGTTGLGGVFKLSRSGDESMLYSFGSNPGDGYQSSGGLVIDKEGNLFGTTEYGGGNGDGNVFEVSPTGQETVIYKFCSQSGCPDGETPLAGLLIDEKGNLYGTTFLGGDTGSCTCCGCGTLFAITPDGKESVFAFTREGGQQPYAPVIAYKGALYGTTMIGGANGQGTVYKVSSTSSEVVLYNFCSQQNCTDGFGPQGPVAVDAHGNLYGTTVMGGAYGRGTIYKVTP